MCEAHTFLDKAKRVNDKLKTLLNKKSIRYNWHESDISVLEGLLARGDRRLSKLILSVYEKGGIYDAWSECFKKELWDGAIAENNIDVDFYVTRARNDDEIFPWDFIDTGVTKKFLLRESGIMPRTKRLHLTVECNVQAVVQQALEVVFVMKIRLRFSKQGQMKFIGHFGYGKIFSESNAS